MAIRVHYFTDPACSASWAAEPKLRRMMVEFGGELACTRVMGGLGRDWAGDIDSVREEMTATWLGHMASSRMPVDPRIWTEGPPASSYPACMAVKAAAEQGPGAETRYLRAVREGLMCFRRKLDTAEALVEEARRAGLDPERFRVDLGSHAIVEAFGADLEATRTVPDQARERGGVGEGDTGERLVFPSLRFEGPGAEDQWVFGDAPYEEWRTAAERVGAKPDGEFPLSVPRALERFDSIALPEVEAVCDLAEVRAQAELWGLAGEWKAKAERVLTGYLWRPA